MSFRKLLLSSALVLTIAAPAFAQDDYTEFVSKEDFFTITFPGKPVVTDGTWLTEILRQPAVEGLHDQWRHW